MALPFNNKKLQIKSKQKQIKTENVQDSTNQKIFDLEKLVFLLVLASVP